MKKWLSLFLLCLVMYASVAQTKYFVQYKHGLVIKDKPSSKANNLGRLPYGSLVELIGETTNETIRRTDNVPGKNVYRRWVKIKYNNFPYIISNTSQHLEALEGYVNRNSLKPLGGGAIHLVAIDKKEFLSLYKGKPAKKQKKITDIRRITAKLGDKVSWATVPYLGKTIDKIYLKSGQVLNINLENADMFITAYYPKEKILVFEGGHSSDFSINLNTGETTETTGNPTYWVYSPRKKYRLNGWFPGQECSNYFFQEKTKDGYKYLTAFGWDTEKPGNDVCYFNLFQWLNDGDFIYSHTIYDQDSKPVEKYFQGSIYR